MEKDQKTSAANQRSREKRIIYYSGFLLMLALGRITLGLLFLLVVVDSKNYISHLFSLIVILRFALTQIFNLLNLTLLTSNILQLKNIRLPKIISLYMGSYYASVSAEKKNKVEYIQFLLQEYSDGIDRAVTLVDLKYLMVCVFNNNNLSKSKFQLICTFTYHQLKRMYTRESIYILNLFITVILNLVVLVQIIANFDFNHPTTLYLKFVCLLGITVFAFLSLYLLALILYGFIQLVVFIFSLILFFLQPLQIILRHLRNCRKSSVFPEVQKPQLDCAICIQSILPDEQSVSLDCHSEHQFHSMCLQSWKKKHNSCPTCREPISVSNRFGILHLNILNTKIINFISRKCRLVLTYSQVSSSINSNSDLVKAFLVPFIYLFLGV